MSLQDPGVIFDATNSWNGYNHQGKIALWFAIHELTKTWDCSKTAAENRQILNDYFLEIEYLEDFAIGKKINEQYQYLSVHQVKDRDDVSVNGYESALLGLVRHLLDAPSLDAAYLHLSVPLQLDGKVLTDYILDMIKHPTYIESVENHIHNNRSKAAFRQLFVTPHRGRPLNLKSNLITALSKGAPERVKLTEDNLDAAFDALINELEAQKSELKIVSANQINKVQLFLYPIGNSTQAYCGVDQVEDLLKNAIKNFFYVSVPGSYKCTDQTFIDKCYLFVLGKLDQHIINRDLNYQLYKDESIDRTISFALILDWLNYDEIDKNGEDFYLYHIKENIFKKADTYCKHCQKDKTICDECEVPVCKDKLGAMSFQQLKTFLYITNPQTSGTLTISTYPEYSASAGIMNPFLNGLRDIPQNFLPDEIAITYQDNQRLQYALTTIVAEGTDEDTAII